MNYGSTGYISENLSLAYSKEIYSAFSLSDNNVLYGLYYPCPDASKDDLYGEVTIKHDFILTPIPFKLWKASARLQIYLQNSPGTLNELYGYFKEKRVSIIHSESSRSSYRYSTLSVHVVLEEILDLSERENLTYSKELRCYVETENAVKDFINSIIEDKKEFLYSLHRQKPVKGTSNYALAFFDFYQNESKSNSGFEPFEVRVHSPDGSHRKQTLQGNDTFKNIMAALIKKEPGLLPATTFSELDTRELNLRTTIISTEDGKRFFKLSIKYNRQGKRDTCVGIVHAITDRMPSRYTIWHSYNRIIKNQEDLESGELVFLIEDISFFMMKNAEKRKGFKKKEELDYRNAESYLQDAANHFERIIEQYNGDLNTHHSEERVKFSKLVVSALPHSNVMKEILLLENVNNDYRDFEYDLFISYSHRDKEYIHNTLLPVLDEKKVSYHLDSKEIHSGQRLDDKLLNNIKNSREMCVVVSNNSAKSEWMVTERGAAWILDKTITPIVIDPTGVEIPQLLHMRIYVSAYDSLEEKVRQSLTQYANDVIDRRNTSLARRYIKTFIK